MTFAEFRKSLEIEFTYNKRFSKYEIIFPPEKQKQTFFWISVSNTLIGTTMCHYEFVEENKIINLEIHFEFIGELDEEKRRIFSLLLKKRLLGKKIEYRYNNIDPSQYQVGILYAHFSSNSDKSVKKSLKILKKMDIRFQRKLSNFIK